MLIWRNDFFRTTFQMIFKRYNESDEFITFFVRKGMWGAHEIQTEAEI